MRKVPGGGTPRLLRRFRWTLLPLVVVTGVFATAVLADVYWSTSSVRDGSSRAILEVSSARLGVVRAYEAAVSSVGNGEAELTGPSERYRAQLAIANQSLARAAEVNTGGEPASRTLQVTAGLLAAFGETIGEVDANVRAQRPVLALANLSYAYRLLHDPSGGLLAMLDGLAKQQRGTLEGEAGDGFWGVLALGLWLLASFTLVAALLVTMVEMARRFRRRLNVPLGIATLVVAATVLAGIGPTIGSLGVLRQTHDALTRHAELVTGQSLAVENLGRSELVTLLRTECGVACGETVSELENESPPPGNAAGANDSVLTSDALEANALAGTAAAGSGVRLASVLFALLLTSVLIALGLQVRLDDYRFARS